VIPYWLYIKEKKKKKESNTTDCLQEKRIRKENPLDTNN